MHITTTHRSGFVPAPIRMTLNDLECPIHLKVRFTDGTLDERFDHSILDSTIRIGIARGGEGEWAGGPSPLPPCGQLTRSFSAVAELLVLEILGLPVHHCDVTRCCATIQHTVYVKDVLLKTRRKKNAQNLKEKV